jgi:hypothetical protein
VLDDAAKNLKLQLERAQEVICKKKWWNVGLVILLKKKLVNQGDKKTENS